MLDIFRRLKATKDNPKYHKEDNVFIHTKMVFKEAQKYDRDIQIAAIFHDYGKTFFETFPFINHERISAFRSIKYLKQLNCDVLRTFKIIAYHDVYKYKSEDLPKLFDYELASDLIKFTECDNLGRITDTYIHDLPTLDFYNFETKYKSVKPIIYMMIGLPGSGKSTFAKTLKLPILSRDELIEKCEGSNYSEKWNNANQEEIDKEFHKLLVKQLELKQSFIIDKTFLTKKSRRRFLNSYKIKDYKVKMIVMVRDFDECIKARQGEKYIDSKVLEKMLGIMSLPTLDEFSDLEIKFKLV